LRDYESLLPTGPRFAIVSEALDAFAPSHLEWDIALELAERHVPPAKLDGRTRLGWTGWLKPNAKSDRIRRDTFLTRQVRRA
jgi:predicted component of type VI protein secretion system